MREPGIAGGAGRGRGEVLSPEFWGLERKSRGVETATRPAFTSPPAANAMLSQFSSFNPPCEVHVDIIPILQMMTWRIPNLPKIFYKHQAEIKVSVV